MALRQPRHSSHSQLEMIQLCPRKYWHSYIRKDRRPAGKEAAIGSLYHHVLALPSNQWGSEGLVSDRARLWRDYTDPAEVAYTTSVTDQELLDNLARLHEHMPTWAASTVGVYRELHLNWGRYRSVLDLSLTAPDHIPSVIDYKIVQGKSRRSQRDAEHSQQLGLYAVQLQHHLGPSYHGPIRAAFAELPRSPTRQARLLWVEYSPAQIARWADWFLEQDAARRQRGVRREAWPRTAPDNPLCSPLWCPYWDACYGGAPVKPSSPILLTPFQKETDSGADAEPTEGA